MFIEALKKSEESEKGNKVLLLFFLEMEVSRKTQDDLVGHGEWLYTRRLGLMCV